MSDNEKPDVKKGVSVSKLKEDDSLIITSSLPLSQLLDSSSRTDKMKEELKDLPKSTKTKAKPSEQEADASTKDSTKSESPPIPSPYIDASLFNRRSCFRSDIKLINSTLIDGKWWTYKAMNEKTGLTIPTLHQAILRVKRALPSIMVKDVNTDGPPIRSHPVRIKIPDHILPIMQSVIAYERPKFSSRVGKRGSAAVTKTKPKKATDGGDIFENLGITQKVNNVEDFTTISDLSELQPTTDSSTTGEGEMVEVNPDDVKAKTLMKLMGDMSLDDVRKALNSYRLRHGGGLESTLQEAYSRKHISDGGNGGTGTSSIVGRLKDAIADGVELKAFMNVLGPDFLGLTSGSSSRTTGGDNTTSSIESLLRLFELMEKVGTIRGGGGGGGSDVEKIAALLNAVKQINEPAKAGSDSIQKSVEDLKTYLAGILEDKQTRQRDITDLHGKLDNLIRDREKKETEEEYEDRINEIKEMVNKITESQRSNQPDAITTFFQLQKELGVSKTESDAKLEILRTELEKQKTEAVNDKLQQLSEKISNITAGKPEDETVRGIRSAVTDIITKNLQKISQLGETEQDIELKKLQQLKEIVGPPLAALKDSVLKPIGDGIGEGLKEQIKRQATQTTPPPQVVTNTTANQNPAPIQVPQSAQNIPPKPSTSMPPPEEKKKPKPSAPFYMP